MLPAVCPAGCDGAGVHVWRQLAADSRYFCAGALRAAHQ
jgi:hypothetical protein